MTHIYNIGTRDSLLAMTQAGLIKNELEKITGKQFRLVPLKTRGDLNTSIPLWQMEGDNFFTKELDQALINGDVDFVIHSYKDLGSKRPDLIKLGAVTKRSYAQDILLIKKEINATKKILVGTSSPRRIVNIEQDLSRFIPGAPKIKCESIRGNVNTRIQKLHDGKYDAIVLALAGLERLASEENSYRLLKELLSNLNFMVLPESVFPSAASQGALAIECLKNRQDIIDLIHPIHHQDTAQEIQREREAFNEYGGGCHLAVGIRVHKIDDLFLHIHKGFKDKDINRKFLEGRNPLSPKFKNVFIGINDQAIKKESLFHTPNDKSYNKIVTSKHCIPWLEKNYQQEILWAAGAMTMERLAKKGFWVNGSMDSLGEKELDKILASKAITLLLNGNRSIRSLSHDKSYSIFGETLSCYKNTYSNNQIHVDADVYYWTSYNQYQYYKKNLGEKINEATHCCGLGKTYCTFKENNIPIIPFSGMKEFKDWINHE